MAQDDFDAPLFEHAGPKASVDLGLTPYFYNDGGKPNYVKSPPVKPLAPAKTDPNVAMGFECAISETFPPKPWDHGMENRLGLRGVEIPYQPMRVTWDVAAAFGITLVKPGECVGIESPHPILDHLEYTYGVFAGHWSPYEAPSRTSIKLIPKVITDLEHHDFPHVFASIDKDLPLVVSVGRYWPKTRKICLADLWVPPGYALYIPPKKPNQYECTDLHGNRNSARACWGKMEPDRLTMHTLLLTGTDQYIYWYWNDLDTVHSPLMDKG